MRKILVLVVCLILPLTGCATYELGERVDTLEHKVTVVENRQDELEDRLSEDEVREPYTNIEPKRTAPAVSGRVTMTKKEVQVALRNAGYYFGAIDGKIGKRSRKAIKEFQADNGLKVDGIAGARTKKALKPYLDQDMK